MYRIKSTSLKGNYTLFKNEEQFSEVIYNNWKFNHAQASYLQQAIEIKVNADQKNQHDIIKNGVTIGHISIDRKLVPHIEVLDQHHKKQRFHLKQEGFWRYKYVLCFSNPEAPAIVLQSNIKRLTTYYDIEKVSATPLNIEVPELVIYSIYALNLLGSYA